MVNTRRFAGVKYDRSYQRGRSRGAGIFGKMPGVRVFVESRFDGFDWAVTVNTDEFPDGTDNDFGLLIDSSFSGYLFPRDRLPSV
jgi:hypothetical protein